jgi:serine/threonine protein kinase
MSKAKIIDKKSERSIKYEKQLLSQMLHPFIVNMYYSFQDTENLYLVMDLLTGGDLRYHISRYKKFNEEQTKFFVGCILLGLDYIHTNNILHRDIKPENLVLDEKGYVRITDFGIAKLYQSENSAETSGTPGYMAPEVMCGQNHTIVVDYFALGVFTYECMFGVRPYTGKSRKEIKDKIIARQVQIKRSEIPEGWSTEAADFINRVLILLNLVASKKTS